MIQPCILAIDFDGTIVDFDFPRIGKLKPFAKEVITVLHNVGFKIIINTCRSERYEKEAIEFLKKNDIPFHTVNKHIVEQQLIDDGVESNIAFYGYSRKVIADYYFDDRSFPPFPGWANVALVFLGINIKEELSKIAARN